MYRQIIAMSGGGFSNEPMAYIDEYIVNQVRKTSGGKVRICFIPTASNDAQGYISKFHNAFSSFEATHILQADMRSTEIRERVLNQDVLYIGGGNTRFMLNQWRATGFDNIMKEAYERGVILAGISAGAMCWFERCYSENENGDYEEYSGLALLEGTFCPHYDDEIRKNTFDQWALTKEGMQMYRLKDAESLHFRNEKLIAKLTT